MASKKRVLVLCTGNSCRSQMAEGLINHVLGESWQAYSAGTTPAPEVHPLAIRAMEEIGIDISSGAPEAVTKYLEEPLDLVITVCDSANQTCPVFPGDVEKRHVPFPDPAEAEGTETERMETFRTVRDSIRKHLVSTLSTRG